VAASLTLEDQVVLTEFIGEFFDFESAAHLRTLALAAVAIHEIACTVFRRGEYWITDFCSVLQAEAIEYGSDLDKTRFR
jgi:hypothetical protein